LKQGSHGCSTSAALGRQPASPRAVPAGIRRRQVSQGLLDEWQTSQLAGQEDYRSFRDALRDDEELRPFVEDGDRRFASRPRGVSGPLAFHREALLLAGFRAVDEVWRHHADAILVGLR
jgi:hypothetical protein